MLKQKFHCILRSFLWIVNQYSLSLECDGLEGKLGKQFAILSSEWNRQFMAILFFWPQLSPCNNVWNPPITEEANSATTTTTKNFFSSCNFDLCIVFNWYDLCIFFPLRLFSWHFLPNSRSYIISNVRDGLLLKFILQRNSMSNNKTKKVFTVWLNISCTVCI